MAGSMKWSHFLRLPGTISSMQATALSAHRKLDLKKPSGKKNKKTKKQESWVQPKRSILPRDHSYSLCETSESILSQQLENSATGSGP